MAQGLVVFPPFNLDISIFYLRPFHCEQFVELNMFRIFDYIYYRLLKQYSKQKWRSNPCSSASIFLCIIQALLVYCIFMFLRPLFVSNAEDLKGIVLAISIAVVMLSLYLFNYHRYKNRDEEIKEKYKDCKANKWFRDWMLFLLMLLLYFLPFLV